MGGGSAIGAPGRHGVAIAPTKQLL